MKKPSLPLFGALLVVVVVLAVLAWWLRPGSERAGAPATIPASETAPESAEALPAPAAPHTEPVAIDARSAAAPTAAPASLPLLGGGSGPRKSFGIRVLDRDAAAMEGATVRLWTRESPNPFAEEIAAGRESYFARHHDGEAADVEDVLWAWFERGEPSWDASAVDASAVTDAEGRCELQLPEGLILVAATVPDDSASACWSGDAWAALVSPDGSATDLVLELSPRCMLTGQVVDESGRPAAGALVLCMSPRTKPGIRYGRAPLPVRTDDEGRYALRCDAPDFYAVVACRADQWSPLQYLGFRGGDEGPLVLRLGTPCAISGEVLGPDGQPVPLASVQARGPNGEHEHTVCDDGGRYRLRVPEGGRWLLGAVHAPHVAADAVAVQISSAGDEPHATLRLVEAATLEGRVIWSGGAPATGFVVTADASFPGNGSTSVDDVVGLLPYQIKVVTDASGAFVIEGLHPDLQYSVSAARAEDGIETKLKQDVRPGTPVELTIDPALAEPGSIAGTVRATESSVPITDFLVRLTRSPDGSSPFHDEWTHVRNAGGSFRFDGQRRTEIYVQARAAGYSLATAGPIVPTAEGVPVTLELGHDAELAVSVKDAFGRSVGGGLVLLVLQPRERLGMLSTNARQMPTDANGRCTWTGLAPGTYLAQAIDAGCSPVIRIDVASGARVSCELVLERAEHSGPVLVTALDAQGAPAPGTSVKLTHMGSADDDETWLAYEAITDETGVARFPAVPPGMYMAQGMIGGRPTFSGLAQVSPPGATAISMRRRGQ